MKKALAIAACLMVALAVSACGANGSSASSPSQDTGSSSESKTVEKKVSELDPVELWEYYSETYAWDDPKLYIGKWKGFANKVSYEKTHDEVSVDLLADGTCNAVVNGKEVQGTWEARMRGVNISLPKLNTLDLSFADVQCKPSEYSLTASIYDYDALVYGVHSGEKYSATGDYDGITVLRRVGELYSDSDTVTKTY